MTIKRQRFLPHAYANRELLFTITELRQGDENIDVDPVFDAERGKLDLRDFSSCSDPILVFVEVRGVDSSLYEKILPAEERQAPPLRYLAVLHDAAGWYRVVAPLKQMDGVASGCIKFSPRDSTGLATLEAVAVRTKTGVRVSGFATRLGMRVASSPLITVMTREPAQTPGGSLDTRWEDFRTSTHSRRKRSSKRIYYLESTAEPPVLWLNRGVTDLVTVLESKATTGQRAVVRDLLNQAIAGPVWYGLIHTAILSVEQDEDELPTVREGWRRGLLIRVAGKLYPGMSREQGFNYLLERLFEMKQGYRDDAAVLIEEMVAAIHDVLDLPEIVRRAFKELA